MDPFVLSVLRQRAGLAKDDSSRDDQFMKLTPYDRFAEVCAWELGSRGWALTIKVWLKICGLELKEI